MNKVSSSQMSCVFFLSLTDGLFFYLSNPSVSITGEDALLRPLIFVVVNAVLLIPLMYYCSRFPSTGILEALSERSRVLSGVVAGVYAVTFSLSAFRTVAKFELFAGAELFQGRDFSIFIIVFITLCIFIASYALRGVFLSGGIFAFLVGVASLIVIVTLIGEVDMLNFTPIEEIKPADILSDGIVTSLFAGEAAAAPIFRNSIEGKMNKKLILSLVFGGALMFFVFFIAGGTLGNFADTQIFPAFSPVTLSKVGIFERLDSLECAVWIVCLVIKLSVLFGSVKKCLCHIFGKDVSLIFTVLAAAVFSVAAVIVSGDVSTTRFLLSEIYSFSIYLIPVTAIPLISLLLLRGRKYEKV